MTHRARTTMLTSTCLMAFLALPIAAIATASCSGTPISPTSTAGPASRSGSSVGSLRLMLTDAPIDDVEQVNIYFTSVTVKPVGKPVEELSIDLPVNPVDLLTLQGTVAEFAAGLVPAGDYEFIHVNIDEDRSSLVVNGVEQSLQIPSEEIKIVGTFNVGGTGTTVLTLDFDAKKSLLLRGNGEWLMRPVIVVTGQSANGGILDDDEDDDEDEEDEDGQGRGRGRGGQGGQ